MSQIGIVNFIGIVIGIVGIILSIVFYFRARKTKRPIFRRRTSQLIQRDVNQIKRLKVYYDDQELPALSISKLVFWNAGRDTILDSDNSKTDHLRIEINKKDVILSCEILKQTKDANNFSVEVAEDKKSIRLDFEYLDNNDGAVLKILHTGSSSDDLDVRGSIKTVKEIQRNEGVRLNKEEGKALWYSQLGLYVVLFLGIFYSLFVVFIRPVFWGIPVDKDHALLAFGIQSIVIVIGFIDAFVLANLNYRAIPKELAEFFGNDDF